EEEEEEDLRSWEGSKKQRHHLYNLYRNSGYCEGPHYRICGPGHIKDSSVTNVFRYPKKHFLVKPFRHPSEIQYTSARMGSYITCMDGLKEKQVEVDAYFLIRNAQERGAMAVLGVMEKFRQNLSILGIGLQCMAGSLLEEDEAGGLTEGQRKYVSMALELLRTHGSIEWIQAEACSALASMSNALLVRRELEKEHPEWLEDVVTAMMQIKSVTQVMNTVDASGKETRQGAA
ncbi:unnamed protein product, partial [Discosporangium mesarthrocarpum]